MEKWIIESGLAKDVKRGIERIDFENGVLIINHTSYEYEIEEEYIKAVSSEGFKNNVLFGHNYAFLLKRAKE